MEEIVSYLFEHSEDIKEGHYLNLMNLLAIAHKKSNNVPIYYERPEPVQRNLYSEFIIQNRRDASPEILISEETWNDHIKEFVMEGNVELLMSLLHELVPQDYNITPGARYKYCFMFPVLPSPIRQKLHIMSKTSQSFHTESFYVERPPDRYSEWTKKIGIFISDF
jgi:hypothetical protein